MAVQITIDQGVLPPGTPGKARQDLATGTLATLSSSGGPFIQYSWRILHPAIDIDTGAASAAVLATPSAASTQINPVDVEGSYLVELVVDSGNGLGAGVEDVARISFYAGTALAANPWDLPRRGPAFKETTEHNVNDAIQPTGNTEGWSREMYRWFSLIRRMWRTKAWAAGRVDLTGAGAVLVRGYNIASVTRTASGTVDVVFTTPMPDANYAVIGGQRDNPGDVVSISELTTGFTIERWDESGGTDDLPFNFVVVLGA